MMDELLHQFLIEARELMAEAMRSLRRLATKSDDPDAIDAAFRAVHTLKGSVALFDMAPAGRVLHAAEDALHRVRASSTGLEPVAHRALLRSLDKVDAWIDAMETEGSLPAEADRDARNLVAQFRADSAMTDAASRPTDRPAWLTEFLNRHAALTDSESDTVTIFRYAPDPECFFRGNDPLALIGTLPDLVVLDMLDRRTDHDLEALDPFHCHLAFEGASTADRDVVADHFRIVGDQTEHHQIKLERTKADIMADPAADTADTILRVDIERIDGLADDIGALVVAGQALGSLVAAVGKLDGSLGIELRNVNANIERSIASLQRRVTAIRLVPIAPAIRRLPRLVRELSEQLGKELDFRIDGEQLEVDKTIADMLFEPLLHLLRNAIDHGVEQQGERASTGKPARADVHLAFQRRGEMLEVRLSDDGRGIDPARIRAVAADRGLVTRDLADQLDDAAAIDLIFMPGFSSADSVSSVSGRGVGMDAVRTALHRLGARIEVTSETGIGTTMTMLFPLNAMTTRMLVVRTGAERYAVPFDRVAETAVVASERVMPLGDGEALILRDRTLPLVHLSEALGGERPMSGELRLLIAQTGSEKVALSVDGFDQRIEARIRPASGILAAIPGVIGTTLLGNGEVLLVLDPESLIA